MSSESRAFQRHDPGFYNTTLAYRGRSELPWSLDAIASDAILMLDTTVYIDAQMAKLPQALSARIATAEIVHSAVALGEIAVSLVLLDPAHVGTPVLCKVLDETLAQADGVAFHRSVARSLCLDGYLGPHPELSER